ncbi:MAG: type ISP restriction/modification enzyme, partial [Bacteroidota bacterium]
DGMRQHLAAEFDEVWIVDLGGNVRKNPKLSGTTHNVFGIQVGVAIAFLVRTRGKGIRPRKGHATIRYAEAGADWKRQRKYDWLEGAKNLDGLEWRVLSPNRKNRWLVSDTEAEFEGFPPLCSKAEKASAAENETTILDEYSRGLETTRDVWVYGFDRDQLAARVEQFVDTYNAAVVKWRRKGGKSKRVEDVVTHDDEKIKWSSSLKSSLKAGAEADFEEGNIRRAMYRPFVKKWVYFDEMLNHRPGRWNEYYPDPDDENRVIWLKVGSAWPMFALMVDQVADVLPQGGSQCLPFYLYREDGTREENLTDWALAELQQRYPRLEAGHRVSGALGPRGVRLLDKGEMPIEPDSRIAKWDVFYYVYAVLHHPEYRERYAEDLKRSLPRIPFAPEFWPFAEASRALAALHVGYEAADPYPLALAHAEGTPLTYRVEKMRLDEAAGTLRLNDSLTLTGIPEAAHRYRLGNRSALGWLVDQLRVKTDKRSGITHDPNASFAGDALVDLVRRVTTVSVETVRLVEALPPLGLPTS